MTILTGQAVPGSCTVNSFSVFDEKMVELTYFFNHYFTLFSWCAGVNPMLLSERFHLENVLHIHVLFHTHADIFNT